MCNPLWTKLAAGLVAVTCWSATATAATYSRRADVPRLQQEVKKLETQLAAKQEAAKSAKTNSDDATKKAKSARDALTKARADSGAAHSEEAAVIAALRKTAETQPDMAAAIAAQKQAQSDYDAVSAKLLGPLADGALYKQAQDNLDSARKAVEEGRGNLDLTPQQRIDLAQKVVDADKAMTSMKESAIDGDPAGRAAKQKLTLAQQAMADQDRKFEASIKNDPKRVAAHKKVEAADTQLKQAEADDTSAAQKAVAARVKLAQAQAAVNQIQARLDQDRRMIRYAYR